MFYRRVSSVQQNSLNVLQTSLQRAAKQSKCSTDESPASSKTVRMCYRRVPSEQQNSPNVLQTSLQRAAKQSGCSTDESPASSKTVRMFYKLRGPVVLASVSCPKLALSSPTETRGCLLIFLRIIHLPIKVFYAGSTYVARDTKSVNR